MDRKLVRPAHEAGRIFNPDHRNFLPRDGAEVEMSPYWIALEQRGDIVAREMPAPVLAAPPATDTEAPAAPAA